MVREELVCKIRYLRGDTRDTCFIFMREVLAYSKHKLLSAGVSHLANKILPRVYLLPRARFQEARGIGSGREVRNEQWWKLELCTIAGSPLSQSYGRFSCKIAQPLSFYNANSMVNTRRALFYTRSLPLPWYIAGSKWVLCAISRPTWNCQVQNFLWQSS